jgi:hypothetical protein
MDPEERERLEKLEAIVRSDELRAKIKPVVVDDLGANPAGIFRLPVATGNSLRLGFCFACRR